MSAYSTLKQKLLCVKYWLQGYSSDEVFIRKTLSNSKTDYITEIGFLISAAFMNPNILQKSLKVVFQRLEASEKMIFAKHVQYYKALLFLQKVCMVSATAKREAKKNYIRILSFVFYSKNGCSLDISIRMLSTSILKQINRAESSPAATNNTFVTCLTHTYFEMDAKEEEPIDVGKQPPP
ncbi:uncharacterized protein NEMAJ01_0910 [Nematocida major]|uniref:uncharacterized protein n=1 Tax=Nematocida major TaxID=1912982 RepID=UPI0020078011|nr:uncharacterized protein NEMAJ01_0910 [Nematocida major]KAH9386014.1 hypothetical protein NEMAJ01_0910 [Nematocida major]